MDSFGAPITALHVLMMYATAGNLDTYLITRAHSSNPTASDLTASGLADGESLGQLPREERIKAFKKRRQSSTGAGAGIAGGRKKREETRGVLLLGVEEIGKLFGDVVEGLAFLVCLLIDPTISTLTIPACQFDSSPRPQMLECPTSLGRRQAHVCQPLRPEES